MVEMNAGGFRNQDDAHSSKIPRIWRKVRSERGPQPEDTTSPRGYETSYDVVHGYSEDRPIIRP